MKTHVRVAVLLGAGLLGFAGSAKATSYELTYSGTSAADGGFKADLFLTTDNSGTVTAVSGSRNSLAVTGVSAYASADNLLLGNYPYFDVADFPTPSAPAPITTSSWTRYPLTPRRGFMS